MFDEKENPYITFHKKVDFHKIYFKKRYDRNAIITSR